MDTLVKDLFVGIVTYNPDIKLLELNISSVKSQVDYIVIVDNHSDNITLIQELANKYHCDLIRNSLNKGIAAALNQATSAGAEKHFDWMLSLDQDSTCPPNFCFALSQFFDVDEKTAIVAPIIRDRKNGIIGHNPESEYADVRTCITSGSCTRVSAWKSVSGYDEVLFIDSVDFDFCYRLRKAGYRILQTRAAVLDHSIGEAKRSKLFNIPHSQHSAFRYYYIARNNIYYPKKNHMYLRMLRGHIRNCRALFGIILFESDKRGKCKSLLRGWIAGCTMHRRDR
ncbi:glycosyltransferase family 2 protein [Bifidobacterium animalis]|uniref:Glycosyl transferase family 2 n=1 Tax=Bifidobacterium animalis subsp. lactis TaxID=302911 RepID=A0A8B3RHB5_BIFAN|nr:glycosyltransferase family 2 protein [Bifidobacterium animalis]RYM93672.1 glycosyl transferase family 2 [Bifidobacterium animalis subsp. lactis]